MLLEFKVKNFKSFLNEAVFSMIPAPKQKGLDYSILNKRINNKDVKSLCSSVIYGPNAAGKTNIIGAMEVLRSIILRGNIKNLQEPLSPNFASMLLELIPNMNIHDAQLVEFSISFVIDNFNILYAINIDLGTFLHYDYKRSIKYEELIVNNQSIFRREKELTLGNIKIIQNIEPSIPIEINKEMVSIGKKSLNPEELFLTNGFKVIFSQLFVEKILTWFKEKYLIIYRADSVKTNMIIDDPQQKQDKLTGKIAELFGVKSNTIAYIKTKKGKEGELYSVLKKNTFLPIQFLESFGTERFLNIFPFIYYAVKKGCTLVVDELDASISPMAIMSIINIFHNDEINTKNAQLIFNTHNPIFLNSGLFRRDEIKFVERDNEENSVLFTLSDLSVRKNEDFLKNYYTNQYGALMDIDFSPLFREGFYK